eukprot:365218-Chlamydomonas_euryale.AAC.4
MGVCVGGGEILEVWGAVGMLLSFPPVFRSCRPYSAPPCPLCPESAPGLNTRPTLTSTPHNLATRTLPHTPHSCHVQEVARVVDAMRDRLAVSVRSPLRLMTALAFAAGMVYVAYQGVPSSLAAPHAASLACVHVHATPHCRGWRPTIVWHLPRLRLSPSTRSALPARRCAPEQRAACVAGRAVHQRRSVRARQRRMRAQGAAQARRIDEASAVWQAQAVAARPRLNGRSAASLPSFLLALH